MDRIKNKRSRLGVTNSLNNLFCCLKDYMAYETNSTAKLYMEILAKFIHMEIVYTKGNNYAIMKSEEMKNSFWKDLLRNWIIFCKSVTIQTL